MHSLKIQMTSRECNKYEQTHFSIFTIFLYFAIKLLLVDTEVS